MPICFKNAYPLIGELSQVQQAKSKEIGPFDLPYSFPDFDELEAVIHKDRSDCSEFMEWQPGSTPKEHREMLDRKWVLDQETKRVEDDRKWRAAQAGLERDWRKGERKARDRDFRVIVAGIIVSAVIALIGAAIAADWIPDPPWVNSPTPATNEIRPNQLHESVPEHDQNLPIVQPELKLVRVSGDLLLRDVVKVADSATRRSALGQTQDKTRSNV